MKTNVELQKDVMHELQYEPVLKSASTEIGVTAKDGTITLVGQVDSYTKKLAAEQAAKRVKGVKVVALDIQVVLPGVHTHSDSDIAQAVSQALKWNSAVEEDRLKVKVENGWIYLEGEVNWSYQKTLAEKSVENLKGIKGVINRMTIVPDKKVDQQQLKREINAAFHRNATLDANTITMDVSGNQVILHGQVRSWAEKKEAERCVWKAPGVTAVENRIEVILPVLL